jgi:hypothetical protein
MPGDRPVPAAPRAATGEAVRLPERVAAFTRAPELRRIGPAGIFEYMDGAGELYLAYRFDHLDVAEYTSPESGDILVELYWMRDPDDAYGLLSQDWGGDPWVLGVPLPPPPRALYGAGLLRLWSDTLYARVMATREGDASRDAVLALGRAIVAGRPDPPPPHLVAALPAVAGADVHLRPETVCFLRSHLVLNSAYFVSQRDILDLGPQTEAVLASYRRRDAGAHGSAARLLVVRYPDAGAADRALARFRAAYLPELRGAPGRNAVAYARVEDGWVGLAAAGRGIGIVFEAPDREVAASLVAAARATLAAPEASHE